MALFIFIFVLVSAVLATFAVSASTVFNLTRAGTPISEGTHEGFFYSWWTDGGSNAAYANGPMGQFSVTWDNGGSLLGGKGWKPGSPSRVIPYNGMFDSTGDSYLAIHGWTQNPLIEYYIIERFGSFNPLIGAIRKGCLTSDGSVYDIGVRTRTNQQSIKVPRSTFQQFWSVRKTKRSSSGTVDLGAHFKAWEAAGMRLGASHYYQILVFEGYFSAGSCSMTVSEGEQI